MDKGPDPHQGSLRRMACFQHQTPSSKTVLLYSQINCLYLYSRGRSGDRWNLIAWNSAYPYVTTRKETLGHHRPALNSSLRDTGALRDVHDNLALDLIRLIPKSRDMRVLLPLGVWPSLSSRNPHPVAPEPSYTPTSAWTQEQAQAETVLDHTHTGRYTFTRLVFSLSIPP